MDEFIFGFVMGILSTFVFLMIVTVGIGDKRDSILESCGEERQVVMTKEDGECKFHCQVLPETPVVEE